MGDFLEEAGDVRSNILKLDFDIRTEADVSMMPAQGFVIVGVVVAQYLACFRMVVLKLVDGFRSSPPTMLYSLIDNSSVLKRTD